MGGLNDNSLVSFGDYSDGFSPANEVNSAGELITGCYAQDDLTRPLGDQNETLLAVALSYRDVGSCPTPTQNKSNQTEIGSIVDSNAIHLRTQIQRSLILETQLKNNRK